MQNHRNTRLIAAAAIVALAGTATADRYESPAQDPAEGDALTGLSAAEQDTLNARVNDLAGFFDTTVSATVVYNTGGNTITADNVRVTMPVLLWENDAFLNTPVIEQLTDGTIAGFTGTFTSNEPGTFQPFLLSTARGTLTAFSNITGANANNTFLDETFNGAQGDFANTRSNPAGQVLASGVAIWDANFNTQALGQNNTEFLDLDGSTGANNGNVIPPNQTSFLNPTPTVAFGSGVKLLRDPAGAVDAGIDDGFATNGSVRLATPSAVQDGALFIQWFGNGWDGVNGNMNTGSAVNGHTIFRATTAGTAAATAVDVTTPQHAWPIFDGGTQWAPAIPGASLGDYRNSNAALFKLDCGTTHIIGSWSITGSSGLGTATGDALVLFIDDANAASSAGNGYTDGAYYIPASPNFVAGSAVGQYMFPASGAGAPGGIGDYRFMTDGVSDNSARTFDANGTGDFVITWQDRSSTPTGTNLFENDNIYEVRLYEATLAGCRVDSYGDPITIARTGTGISERGITYDNGFTFDIPKTIFCNGTTPGVDQNVSFSGAAIDNAGNVSFTATTEVFTTTLIEDPMTGGFPTFASCFDGSEDGSGVDGELENFLDGSTTGLFYYIRSEDALLKLVDGGIGGTELASDVAGAPEALSVVLGRFTGDDDSDRFGGNSMSNTGDTMAVAFRNGSFDRDADNDGDSDDPAGVFLDGGQEEDGGLLLDRSQVGFENQVVTAVRGAAVVELGEVVIAPANSCVGDFDNDGDVDLGDFGVFGSAFNSMAGDANYNPAADFDMDGDVDLGDFGVFGGEFGRMDCLG